VSEHVDGEEEQLEALAPRIRNVSATFALLARRPIPDAVLSSLEWLAREAFRLGYQHAHSRHTIKHDLFNDSPDE
jgi:DNA polymerase III epsilon subunit-like protein